MPRLNVQRRGVEPNRPPRERSYKRIESIECTSVSTIAEPHTTLDHNRTTASSFTATKYMPASPSNSSLQELLCDMYYKTQPMSKRYQTLGARLRIFE